MLHELLKPQPKNGMKPPFDYTFYMLTPRERQLYMRGIKRFRAMGISDNQIFNYIRSIQSNKCASSYMAGCDNSVNVSETSTPDCGCKSTCGVPCGKQCKCGGKCTMKPHYGNKIINTPPNDPTAIRSSFVGCSSCKRGI